MKRPLRTLALEPSFAKRNSRAFVCGGMAGNLVMREKGWLGHKEIPLHSGEGPIWQVRWRDRLIAWANDLVGVLLSLRCRDLMTLFRVSKFTILRPRPVSPLLTDNQIVRAQIYSNAICSGRTIPLYSLRGPMSLKLLGSVRVRVLQHLPRQLIFRLFWLKSPLCSRWIA